MARWILLGGAIAWLMSGAAGLLLAAFGTEALERLLPPLAIDTDALRGAVTALGAGLLAIGLIHVTVLAGLRSGRRSASSAAILLAGVLAATLLALAASAATSAVAGPSMGPALLGAGLAAAAGAAAYAIAAIRLVAARRSGSAH